MGGKVYRALRLIRKDIIARCKSSSCQDMKLPDRPGAGRGRLRIGRFFVELTALSSKQELFMPNLTDLELSAFMTTSSNVSYEEADPRLRLLTVAPDNPSVCLLLNLERVSFLDYTGISEEALFESENAAK